MFSLGTHNIRQKPDNSFLGLIHLENIFKNACLLWKHDDIRKEKIETTSTFYFLRWIQIGQLELTSSLYLRLSCQVRADSNFQPLTRSTCCLLVFKARNRGFSERLWFKSTLLFFFISYMRKLQTSEEVLICNRIRDSYFHCTSPNTLLNPSLRADFQRRRHIQFLPPPAISDVWDWRWQLIR